VGASELLTANQTAMYAASAKAREQAVAAAVGLAVVVTAALLSFGFLSRVLQQQLLGRLHELRVVTEAVSSGEPARRARTGARDELGLVASCLNDALDKQHQLEAQMRGRLAEQRQVLVGLLARWHTPAAVAGVDGEIVASTLSPDDEDVLHELTPQVRQAARVLLTRKFLSPDELATDVIVRGRTVHIRALTARNTRVVGWFATFDTPFAAPPAAR
jgi:hypothetical protein